MESKLEKLRWSVSHLLMTFGQNTLMALSLVSASFLFVLTIAVFGAVLILTSILLIIWASYKGLRR